MKKFVVILLSLIIFAVPVLAQTEEQPIVLDWNELEKQFVEDSFFGEFQEFEENGLKIIVPSIMTESTEFSDEMKEEGYIAFYYSDTDPSLCLVISTVRSDEPQTPSEFVENLIKQWEDAEIDGIYQINGANAVIFHKPDTDPACDWKICVLESPKENVLVYIQINPATNEVLASLADYIFGSVQFMETAQPE